MQNITHGLAKRADDANPGSQLSLLLWPISPAVSVTWQHVTEL